jgi:hypothetical protein
LQIQKQADFCQEALNSSIHWAGNVIMSDESRFG